MGFRSRVRHFRGTILGLLRPSEPWCFAAGSCFFPWCFAIWGPDVKVAKIHGSSKRKKEPKASFSMGFRSRVRHFRGTILGLLRPSEPWCFAAGSCFFPWCFPIWGPDVKVAKIHGSSKRKKEPKASFSMGFRSRVRHFRGTILGLLRPSEPWCLAAGSCFFPWCFPIWGPDVKVAKIHGSSKRKKEPKASFSMGFRSRVRHFRGTILGLLRPSEPWCFAAGSCFFPWCFPIWGPDVKVAKIHGSSKRKKEPKASFSMGFRSRVRHFRGTILGLLRPSEPWCFAAGSCFFPWCFPIWGPDVKVAKIHGSSKRKKEPKASFSMGFRSRVRHFRGIILRLLRPSEPWCFAAGSCFFPWCFPIWGPDVKVAKIHGSSKRKKEPKASFSMGFRSHVRHFRGTILGLLRPSEPWCFAAGSCFFPWCFPIWGPDVKVAKIHGSSKRKKEPKASFSMGFRSHVRHFRGTILGLLRPSEPWCFAAGSCFFPWCFAIWGPDVKVAKIHGSSKRKKEPKASFSMGFRSRVRHFRGTILGLLRPSEPWCFAAGSCFFPWCFPIWGPDVKVAKIHGSSKRKKEPKASFSMGFRSRVRHFRGTILGLLRPSEPWCFAAGSCFFPWCFPIWGPDVKVAKIHGSSKRKKEPKASFSMGFRSRVRHFRGTILGLLRPSEPWCFAAGSCFFPWCFPIWGPDVKVAKIHGSSKRKKEPKASFSMGFRSRVRHFRGTILGLLRPSEPWCFAAESCFFPWCFPIWGPDVKVAKIHGSSKRKKEPKASFRSRVRHFRGTILGLLRPSEPWCFAAGSCFFPWCFPIWGPDVKVAKIHGSSKRKKEPKASFSMGFRNRVRHFRGTILGLLRPSEPWCFAAGSCFFPCHGVLLPGAAFFHGVFLFGDRM